MFVVVVVIAAAVVVVFLFFFSVRGCCIYGKSVIQLRCFFQFLPSALKGLPKCGNSFCLHFRKKFGWVSLVFGILMNLMYVLPLTSLAVYTRRHEEELCGFNSSVPDEVQR